MPLFEYHCAKYGSYDEYLVQTPKKHPLNCSCCGKKGGLERLAVQPFSVGSSSTKPSASVRCKDQKDYQTKTDILRASGGRELGAYTVSTSKGSNIHHIWATPKTGNN